MRNTKSYELLLYKIFFCAAPQKPLPSIHKLIYHCLNCAVSPDDNACAVDVTFGTTEFGVALGRAFVQVSLHWC